MKKLPEKPNGRKKQEIARALQAIGAVRFGRFILKSGRVSDIYIDVKAAFGFPRTLERMGRALCDLLHPRATCIACSGYGGLPLGVVTSRHTGLPLTLIRETPKKHGRTVWIDGYVPTGRDRVALIDDVHSSGTGLRHMERILRTKGSRIIGRYVVVNRSTSNPLRVQSVLSLKDLKRPSGAIRRSGAARPRRS